MREFLKEHPVIRMCIIAVLFLAGLVLVFTGWKLTGSLSGLGRMVLGVALLIAAIAVYNKPFE